MVNMTVPAKEGGRIPEELIEFFSQGGRSLILRGAPGTGKTTLALEILDHFRPEGESIFISARVDEQALKSHLRWVNFDMLLSRGKDEGSRQKKKGTLSRKELDRLESRVEEGDETLEGDYDPEPGSGNLEGDAWTIDITALLPEIDSLYEKLEKGGATKAIVAIDSIDSLAEKYGIAPRRLIHTLQKDLVERTGINVIFILETAETSTLDYMGDGVISLESTDTGGRRLRVMGLEKLRGQSIWHPEFTFSLAGGRFDSFVNRIDAHRNNEPGKLRMVLDGPLEGIVAPGRYSLLEFDGSVSPEVIRNIAGAVIEGASAASMDVYTTPSLRLLGPENGQSRFQDCMKTISPISLTRQRSGDDSVNLVDGEFFDADFNIENIRKMFPGDRPKLFLMDANQLISHYGRDAIRDIETHISHLVRDGGACICFTWPDSNSLDMDMGMSERHLRIETHGSEVLMYGIKPHTSNHILAPDRTDTDKIVLRPIL
jgi:KaiC/GvpD/RAD55 family RecA-like ATPase